MVSVFVRGALRVDSTHSAFSTRLPKGRDSANPRPHTMESPLLHPLRTASPDPEPLLSSSTKTHLSQTSGRVSSARLTLPRGIPLNRLESLRFAGPQSLRTRELSHGSATTRTLTRVSWICAPRSYYPLQRGQLARLTRVTLPGSFVVHLPDSGESLTHSGW